jgi:hypothetical protein
MACACLGPASGKSAVGRQHGDLLVQQVTLDQRRPEPGLQPIALQFVTRGGTGRQGSFAGSQESVANRSASPP